MALWKYEPKFLYEFHLTLCYFLIALIFSLLIVRCIKTPSVYRQKYLVIILGIVFVVALNAVYLFIPLQRNIFDFSVLFYSLIGFFMFWNRCFYSAHGMLTKVRQTVLDELGQPVFLFDEGSLPTMHNKPAEVFVRNLIMILDVDCFKNYNDTYGHQAGDKLLSLAAMMLCTEQKKTEKMLLYLKPRKFHIFKKSGVF